MLPRKANETEDANRTLTERVPIAIHKTDTELLMAVGAVALGDG